MVRLDDDLYTRIFETAHDQRQSMNSWICRVLDREIVDWRLADTIERVLASTKFPAEDKVAAIQVAIHDSQGATDGR